LQQYVIFANSFIKSNNFLNEKYKKYFFRVHREKEREKREKNYINKKGQIT